MCILVRFRREAVCKGVTAPEHNLPPPRTLPSAGTVRAVIYMSTCTIGLLKCKVFRFVTEVLIPFDECCVILWDKLEGDDTVAAGLCL